VFLVLFMGMYQRQLEQKQAEAAGYVNRVLQTSLEAAMLRRDLATLGSLVHQLGSEDGVDSVMIVNPAGEVRFSDQPDDLGRVIPDPCPQCEADPRSAGTVMVDTRSHAGGQVLRSSHPVHNKPPYEECHGPVDTHPINGILLVDYDRQSMQRHARDTTLALMGSGSIVVLITLAGGWWFMQRYVLRPVHQLAQASRALAAGHLDTRTELRGEDELAQLGTAFDHMADALQESLNEIHEKQVFLQGLVDAIPDGVRVLDGDYRIVLANRTYREQQGLTDIDPVGDYCYASSHHRDEPCVPTLVTCPLHDIPRELKPIKTVHRHLRADGTPHDFEIFASPLRIRRNGRTRLLVVESIRDLSEDVRFSHEQKLSELGRLAAGVAHEIHNPLTSIRLTLDAVTRSTAQGEVDQDRMRRCLELVEREAQRCLDVTDRLLKLSMFAGEQPQPVAVNPAISETLSLLQEEAARCGITITQSLDPSKPRILANESDIRMVVLNLAQNAFHAMPEGGRLKIFTHRGQGRIEMRFEDTGVGIAPAHKAHIFDPFFSRRADQANGTGLGLAISRTIVERYGGSMEVDSAPGEGSTFTIRFQDPEAGGTP
jgi:signal transduction histidine kinase